jgi:hypothetical protein
MVFGDFPPGFIYGAHAGPRPQFQDAEKLYSAEGALRQRVAANGDTIRYSGEKGGEFQASYDSDARGIFSRYMRIRGEVHEVIREISCGKWRCHFTDHRPCGWRRVRCVQAESGRQAYYEGRPQKEKLVMKITKRGHFFYYEGDRKNERLVRMWCPAGGVHNNKHDHLAFYEGGHKQEHLVRQEWANGDVTHFEGERGKETKVSRVFATGTVQTYEGEARNEHLAKEVKATGLTYWFMGLKGHERRVREQMPNGTIRLLKGSKGEEYVTTELVFPETGGECLVTQYDVQLRLESAQNRQTSRKRRVLLADGSMLFFPGFDEVPAGSANRLIAQHPRRIITPAGHLLKRANEEHLWKRVQEGQFVGSMGSEQRKRLKTATSQLWSAMENLAEAGSVQESALVAMGDHFKHLNSQLDE